MSYQTIDKGQLKAWLDVGKDFALIDVLSQESFNDGHLPGSVHADVAAEDFLEKIQKLAPDKNKPIVVYCRAGNTSPGAAEKLIAAGYTEVYDYKGGTSEWGAAGYPLEGEAV